MRAAGDDAEAVHRRAAGYLPDRTYSCGLVENFSDYKDTLQVTRDSSDKNRLNFICHPNLVNQLRVLAGLIQFKL
ncbi:phage tail sheath C-terminal domain-containing protein [Escherichia coli]|uniref:phage tail sheath C-terminal domain-containing protein n=1 Tax=Escherichia coli TaxID=562 RepID=UPI002FCCFA10